MNPLNDINIYNPISLNSINKIIEIYYKPSKKSFPMKTNSSPR